MAKEKSVQEQFEEDVVDALHLPIEITLEISIGEAIEIAKGLEFLSQQTTIVHPKAGDLNKRLEMYFSRSLNNIRSWGRFVRCTQASFLLTCFQKKCRRPYGKNTATATTFIRGMAMAIEVYREYKGFVVLAFPYRPGHNTKYGGRYGFRVFKDSLKVHQDFGYYTRAIAIQAGIFSINNQLRN